jgi:methylglyoxal synthase
MAWAGAHRATLATMRLLAPAGIGALLAEHVGLAAEPLKSGTVGPAATAGLAAAGDIDAMIAFSDPIELRPGDNTTRSLTRLAIFWDIPIASNRATADLLLATVTAASPLPPSDLAAAAVSPAKAGEHEPVRGAIKLWTVRATVDDVPGRLAILAASLARRAINILSVQVHLTPDGPVDELLVAASPVLSAADLTAAVVDGGARAPRIAVADAHALVDGPTRALTLATRLVRTPEDLPAVLLSLLPGAQLSWRAEAPEGHDDNLTQLWLVDPTGGGFMLTRPSAPFTPAECARAFALTDVATVAMARLSPVEADGDTFQVVLTDGVEVTIRRATPDDVEGVVELHARCSMTSRLRRYLAGTRCPTDATLARLLSPTAGRCLVVEDVDGRLVAMANLVWEGDSPELALLIEDSWQQRRLGTVLARRLAVVAAKSGAHGVKAVIHAGNTPMMRIMSSLGHRLHREYDGGLLTLIATLQPSSGHTQRLPNNIRLIQSA